MQKANPNPEPPSLRRGGRARLPRLGAWAAIPALILASTVLYGLGLGTLDLWAPDEPRYAAIAEELRSNRHGATGWVLLHLNDEPYTQKPPLYFWLAAAAGAIRGRVDELAARLPSALAGVLVVGATALVARLLGRDARASLLAATLLATSWRFAFTARRAQLDVLLTLFELSAVAIFLWLETRRGGAERARAHPRALVGLHGSLGLAALVKGPVGWLPLLVMAVHLAWQGRARAFRALAPAWAWALSIGPLALWIASAVALAPAGFAEEAIGDNVFGRFFAGTSHVRPFYYYLYQLPADFLPWSVLLPFALPALWRRARRPLPPGADRPSAPEPVSERAAPDPGRAVETSDDSRSRSAARFLIVWLGAPFLFFTLSAGKRGLYLLPILPALAITVTFALGPRGGARPSRGERRLIAAIASVAVLELAIFTLALPRLHSEKSPRPIAEAAAAYSRPGERIGLYGLGPLEGGIAYYGDRPIASLRDESALRDFLADGGRLVLLRARHHEQLATTLGLEQLAAFRGGRRRLVLARSTAVDPRWNESRGALGRTRPELPEVAP